MNMEDTSKKRPFFTSPEDMFDEEYYDEQMPEKKRRLTPEQVRVIPCDSISIQRDAMLISSLSASNPLTSFSLRQKNKHSLMWFIGFNWLLQLEL